MLATNIRSATDPQMNKTAKASKTNPGDGDGTGSDFVTVSLNGIDQHVPSPVAITRPRRICRNECRRSGPSRSRYSRG
jgi:hypothetical protein